MEKRDSSRFPETCIALAIVAAVLAIYAEVATHRFVLFDDTMYVTDNYFVLQGLTGESVAWAFGLDDIPNYWHPLAFLSHMVDVECWGLQAGGHALTNVWLHTLASVLLFVFVLKLTRHRWVAAFVALVFAIHPANVESVAWIAERKSVLSAVFWFATLLAYLDYVGKPTVLRYGAVVLTFALALLSKPAVVTLPGVLLLLDFWPLGRWGGVRPLGHFEAVPGIAGGWVRRTLVLVAEKLPLFAFAGAVSALTLAAVEQAGALTEGHVLPLSVRVPNVMVGVADYLRMFFWPGTLAAFYPFQVPESRQLLMAAPLVASLSLGATILIRRVPAAFVGWFWFGGALLPVVGLIQAGGQRIADRYLYLSMPGLALMVAWVVVSIPSRWKWGRLALGVASIPWLAWLGWRAHEQVKTWRDDASLCAQVARVGAPSPLLLNNLALANAVAGEPTAAVEVLGSLPSVAPLARWNLGAMYLQQGRFEEVIELMQSVSRAPNTPASVHYHLARAYAALGQGDEARLELERCRAKIPAQVQWRNSIERLRRVVNAPDFSIEQYAPSGKVREGASPSYPRASRPEGGD